MRKSFISGEPKLKEASLDSAGGLLLQVPEAALVTNRAAFADARFAAAVSSAGSDPTPLQVGSACGSSCRCFCLRWDSI